MSICKHFMVSGRVQGVFYRASTEAQARSLGLSGWVRNCPDGRVELVACGDETKLAALEQWLWKGPRHAQVDAVTASQIAEEDYQGFGIRW